MQCKICGVGSIWTEEKDIPEITKEGFYRKIQRRDNPEKFIYFFICGPCLEGWRELINQIIKDKEDEARV